jgi:hypothetical protein
MLFELAHPQWQLGGGRSHDRVTLEFRATRWNVVVPSPSSLQDLGAALWDLQQHLNPAYPGSTGDGLDPSGLGMGGGGQQQHPHENVNRTGSASSSSSLSGSYSSSALPRRMLALPPSFPDELNILQRLLPFPEEVALKLTETEFQLFNSVPPIDYLRYCTTDLTARHHHHHQASAAGQSAGQQHQPSGHHHHHQPFSSSQQQSTNAQPAENGVPSLIRRFNEVQQQQQSAPLFYSFVRFCFFFYFFFLSGCGRPISRPIKEKKKKKVYTHGRQFVFHFCPFD